MLVVETITRIRRDHLVKGVPIKKIARDLRVSKNTVRKVVRSDETSFSYARAIQPMPKLGPWVEGNWRVVWRPTRRSSEKGVEALLRHCFRTAAKRSLASSKRRCSANGNRPATNLYHSSSSLLVALGALIPSSANASTNF